LTQSMIEYFSKDQKELGKELGGTMGNISGTIVFQVLLAVLTAGVGLAWTGIRTGIKTVMGIIGKVVKKTIEAVLEFFKTIKKIFTSIFNGIKGLIISLQTKVSKLFKGVKGKFDTIIDKIKWLIDDIFEKLGLSKKPNAFHATEKVKQTQSVLDGIDPKYFNPNSRFGEGFYVASEGDTAVAELASHNVKANYLIRYKVNLNSKKVLDFTDINVAKKWGFQKGITSPADCKIIASKARKSGYEVISFPSYQGSGTNYVIFNNFKKYLNVKMVVPIE